MIMPAFTFSSPSGSIRVPSLLMPSRPMAIALEVPSGPNSPFTMTEVSTQSRMCSGSTSKSALNMNQKPDMMTRNTHRWGLESSSRESCSRLPCLISPAATFR